MMDGKLQPPPTLVNKRVRLVFESGGCEVLVTDGSDNHGLLSKTRVGGVRWIMDGGWEETNAPNSRKQARTELIPTNQQIK